jgi:hypothetical protein
MDIFDEDLLLFWKSLADNNISYIMVGKFAASIHGHLGFSQFLEVWIRNTKANRENFAKVMNQYGYNELLWGDVDFAINSSSFNIGNGLKLELFINMKGLEGYSFDECLQMATIAEIEKVKIPFLHINHLIANKKAVNRPKDKLDVTALEKIVQLRKEMGLD